MIAHHGGTPVIVHCGGMPWPHPAVVLSAVPRMYVCMYVCMLLSILQQQKDPDPY